MGASARSYPEGFRLSLRCSVEKRDSRPLRYGQPFDEQSMTEQSWTETARLGDAKRRENGAARCRRAWLTRVHVDAQLSHEPAVGDGHGVGAFDMKLFA